jgi:predicted ATPase
MNQLERAAGFRRGDDARNRIEKLDALLSLAAASAEDKRLIADLLSLQDTGFHPTPALSPQQRRQQTTDVLMRQLAGLAYRQPVLQVFEDVHWIDRRVSRPWIAQSSLSANCLFYF